MADVVLTNEDLKIFEQFYQRRLLDEGGAADDATELEIARDILMTVVNDGLTPTADGGESFVRRGAMDWSDPAVIQATQATAAGNGGRKSKAAAGIGGKGGPKELVQGVLMLVAALAVAAWFFWPKGDGRSEADLTPTVDPAEMNAAATATPIPTLEAELLADIVDAGVKTSLVVPRTLEVKGVSFVVQPVKVTAGDWPRPDDERAVSWVYGTVINYTLGLEATAANKQLLSSLGPGDMLLLRMSTGAVYRFAFADMVKVAPQASEVFRQNRPGLTVALLGDEEESSRTVVRALYLPESELGLETTGVTHQAALNEPVVIEDTFRVTALSRQLLDLPGMRLPGYIYLGLDYVLENQGSLPLVTGSFVHQVEAVGMSYPPVAVTSQATGKLPYPPLPEMLLAGEVLTTTAVYAIPEAGLNGSLVWSFAPSPEAGEVHVSLPPVPPLVTSVTVRNASLQNGILSVTFYLESPAQDLEITASDVKIEGGTLSPIGNFFPWRAPAGNSREFTLLFSPAASGHGRLVVSFLRQAFEITY